MVEQLQQLVEGTLVDDDDDDDGRVDGPAPAYLEVVAAKKVQNGTKVVLIRVTIWFFVIQWILQSVLHLSKRSPSAGGGKVYLFSCDPILPSHI